MIVDRPSRKADPGTEALPQFVAKWGCRHCHGRGVTAWREDGQPVLCRCIRRQVPRGVERFKVERAPARRPRPLDGAAAHE